MGKFVCVALICLGLMVPAAVGQASTCTPMMALWTQWYAALEVMKSRHEAYIVLCDARMKEVRAGVPQEGFTCEVSLELLQCELLEAVRKADRVAAHAAHLERMQELLAVCRKKADSNSRYVGAIPVALGAVAHAKRCLQEAKAAPE